MKNLKCKKCDFEDNSLGMLAAHYILVHKIKDKAELAKLLPIVVE